MNSRAKNFTNKPKQLYYRCTEKKKNFTSCQNFMMPTFEFLKELQKMKVESRCTAGHLFCTPVVSISTVQLILECLEIISIFNYTVT
jgi:hypothetical protein